MKVDMPQWIGREELLAALRAPTAAADGADCGASARWARAERLERARLHGLWAAGSLASLHGRVVAVVGSRAPSEAGRARAEQIGRTLAEAGVCVISGLALGIDAAAHQGALAGGGATVGVLGGGHRQFFPRRNLALGRTIAASGGAVLSPFPPDEPARPGQFLERNGVIAVLADAVVVVEAAARSGSLNTAGWAAAAGVHVFAVPGDVDRAKAAGCNALIRDGATLARDGEDVLADLGIAIERPTAGRAGSAAPRAPTVVAALPKALAPLAERVTARLAREPAGLEHLAAALADRGAPDLPALLGTLALLEVHGAIRREDDGRYALASNLRA